MEHFAMHKPSKIHPSLLPKISDKLRCGNMDSAVYYYHSDHLGSASWITNGNGTPVQHLQYMPYGEPFVNERTTGYEERSYSPLLHYHYVSTSLTVQIPNGNAIANLLNLLHTGKERYSETGFSYFGARYYDSDLMTGWLSVDPMADKYPNISPYAYCGWNPVRLVDPDGEDVWELNNEGRVVNRITTTEVDAFHIVDDKGNRLAGKSIEFEYGTVESHRYISYFNEEKKAKDTYDVYQVRGDDNGTKLFEFMATHTNVEWSQAKTGEGGYNGLNFLTTAHDKGSEYGMSNLYSTQLFKGYTIRELIHNHPSNKLIPSGLDKSKNGIPARKWGDIKFSIDIVKDRLLRGYNLPVFKIYSSKNNSYISYGPNSQKTDFIQ